MYRISVQNQDGRVVFDAEKDAVAVPVLMATASSALRAQRQRNEVQAALLGSHHQFPGFFHLHFKLKGVSFFIVSIVIIHLSFHTSPHLLLPPFSPLHLFLFFHLLHLFSITLALLLLPAESEHFHLPSANNFLHSVLSRQSGILRNRNAHDEHGSRWGEKKNLFALHGITD